MSKNKLHKILKLSAPILALICAVTCAFAFGYAFDNEAGYFNRSVLPYVFYILLALTLAISVAAAVTAEKRTADEKCHVPDRRAIGIILICSLAFYLTSFILTSTPGYMAIKLSSNASISLFPIIIVGLLISIAHFVIVAFFSRKVGSGAIILTGIAVVLTAIIIATASYFDHTQALNSPHKLLYEFAFIAFALYYITELRLYTDAPREKLLTALSGISTALSLCAGVSVIFEILLNSDFTALNIATAILLATMASCSASKLLEP